MKIHCEAYGLLASCGKKGVGWFRKGHRIMGTDYWLCQKHLDRAEKEKEDEKT